MTTAAQVGIGATLSYWDTSASTPVWVEIVEVTAISNDGPTRNTIDVFKLNNENDYVNKLQGTIDAGTFTATVNYTKEQYTELKNQLETRGNRTYQIALPNGEGFEFDGFITEIPLDIGSDDVIQGDVVFVIDGKADFMSAVS